MRSTAAIPYRADIDGMRAVAVLMVLLFHCGFGAFRGGFVGVDIFFVISGYLITSLIVADLQRGTFNFYRFYSRRVRRLLPAMLATILVAMLGSMAIMSPEHLVDASKSGAFALLSVSNFYFAKAAGYFDASGQFKPLLHTWSLGVEEQYYLLWPAILFLLYRYGGKWALLAVVLGGALVGLALSEYGIGWNPHHAYFLLPFRAFQFLLGAACIWLLRLKTRNRLLAGSLCLVGLATDIAAACFFTEETPFPGLAALVPSIATMLVIWQGGSNPLQGLLGNRPMVWLGGISYSTYLIHWPIVVFWSYLAFNPLSLLDKLALFGLCLLGGQALYWLVEQRFRYGRSGDVVPRYKLRIGMAGAAVMAATLCAVPIMTSGLPGRLALVPGVAEYRHQTQFRFTREYADGGLSVGPEGGARVLIFGDSMMQNYVPALRQIEGFSNARIDIVSRGGCVLAKDALLINHGSLDTDCLNLRERLFALRGPYEVVLWSQNWMGYGDTLYWQQPDNKRVAGYSYGDGVDRWKFGIERTLKHFRAMANQVVVIGPAVSVANVNTVLTRIGPLTDIEAIPGTFGAMHQALATERDALSRDIGALVTRGSANTYVDPSQIICMEQLCRFWSGRYSYFLDELHNTSAATGMLREGLERQGVRLPNHRNRPLLISTGS